MDTKKLAAGTVKIGRTNKIVVEGARNLAVGDSVCGGERQKRGIWNATPSSPARAQSDTQRNIAAACLGLQPRVPNLASASRRRQQTQPRWASAQQWSANQWRLCSCSAASRRRSAHRKAPRQRSQNASRCVVVAERQPPRQAAENVQTKCEIQANESKTQNHLIHLSPIEISATFENEHAF